MLNRVLNTALLFFLLELENFYLKNASICSEPIHGNDQEFKTLNFNIWVLNADYF